MSKLNTRLNLGFVGAILSSALYLFFVLVLQLPAVNALSAEQQNLFNSGILYFDANAGSSSTTCSDSTVQSAGIGTIGRLLQAIAQHESGGDPSLPPNGGGASGRYQDIQGTWQGRAKLYDGFAGTNFAGAYSEAYKAPVEDQDAVQYVWAMTEASSWKGSVFRIEIDQYLPAANSDYSLLDQIPAAYAGNTETVRQNANKIVDWYNQGDGSQIRLNYSAAQGFDKAKHGAIAKYGQTPSLWAKQVPAPNPPPDNPPSGAGGPTNSGIGCSSSNTILSVIQKFAWPDFQGTDSFDKASGLYVKGKPAYISALQTATYKGGTKYLGADCGAFVTAVMKASSDPNFNSSNGPTTTQEAYMGSHPNLYKKLGQAQAGDINWIKHLDLKPGDIAVTANHTYFYIGSAISGWGGNTASASLDTRTAMADGGAYPTDSEGISFTWYRLIGGSDSG